MLVKMTNLSCSFWVIFLSLTVLEVSASKLGNISTRAFVGTGSEVLIGGFVISGEEDKIVLIRALGPSLAQSGISAFLENPTVKLFKSGTPIDENDDWEAHPAASAIPNSLKPNDFREAAILATLSPGAYTGIVRGANASTGIALIEVYEIDGDNAQLINISTRGLVGVGEEAMIGGLVITGTEPKTVVIRALGLTLSEAGIENVLQDPVVKIFSSQGAIDENDDQLNYKFSDFVPESLRTQRESESVVVRTLSPGAYTAIVRGVAGTSGVALIEVYDVESDGSIALPASDISDIEELNGIIASGGNVNIITDPVNGDIRSVNGGFEYEASAGFIGQDQFSYSLEIDGATLRRSISIDVSLKLTDISFNDTALEDCIAKTSASLVNEVTTLECSDSGITSTTGLAFLTDLINLDLSKNSLGRVDLSSNTKLKALNLSETQLLAIDLSFNRQLEELILINNRLVELDTSNNSQLRALDVTNNDLALIDISNNVKLTTVDFERNNLTTIDITSNKELEELSLFLNRIPSIDVSSNLNLTSLNLSNNDLTNVDVLLNSNLKELNISSNQISSLDVSNNIALEKLRVGLNSIDTIDVTHLTKLTYLSTSLNNLTSIDITQNSKLTFLELFKNDINEIDVSNNPELTFLGLSVNNLSSLNVENNPALTELRVFNNNLTSINVSNNVLLTRLLLSGNQISFIDLDANDQLTFLNMFTNPLSCSSVSTIQRNHPNMEFLFDGCGR